MITVKNYKYKGCMKKNILLDTPTAKDKKHKQEGGFVQQLKNDHTSRFYTYFSF